ncbi:MAG: hemolysin III family protein [Acidimicrobiales bacterium]
MILTPTFSPTTWTTELLVQHPIYGARPSLRGRFHQLGAAVSVPAGGWLLLSVDDAGQRVPAAIYAITALVMFATSAAYHRLAQSVKARFWMRRLDHSMIFVHMAGATTPLGLVVIGGALGIGIVVASWLLTIVGVGLKMTRLTADHDPCSCLFPLLGGLPLVAIPFLAGAQQSAAAALLLTAGLLYTAGATCFVRKAPNPRPSVFGYHEIWHVFTLAAGACEFWVMVEVLSA